MRRKKLARGSKLVFSLLWLIMVMASSVYSKDCEKVDSCSCNMSDGSGKVNLHSLALEALPGETLAEAAFGVFGDDGYTYNYNPCNGFSFYPLNNLAIVQITARGDLAYDLGIQETANFVYTDASGLSVNYVSAVDKRKSKVFLVCQPNLNAHTFEFVGEDVALEYEFILLTPCACPGMCDDNGPTMTLPTPLPSTGEDVECIYLDSCTCVMSDGSGQINLHSTALSSAMLRDAAFTVVGDDGWHYKYNPCWGFRAAGYTDLSVLQSSDTSGSSGYDLGVQSNTTFHYNATSGLTISYVAADNLRKSRIMLTCTLGATEHKLKFIGEMVSTEYDFIFASPCACPGSCNSEGIIGATLEPPPVTKTCTQADSCTCDTSDGSGQINLRSLGLQAVGGQTLEDAAFSILGDDGWTYKYNPCYGFAVASLTDLAVLQTNNKDGNYDVGVQTTAKFVYSESSGWSVHYESGIPYRSSRVLLVCEPNLNVNTFEFVGELDTLEYDFILSTPCACPGRCNDDGPTVPLPTATSMPPTDVTCERVDSCTCEMSDGSGRVNLHGPAIEGQPAFDEVYSVIGDDQWMYTYNPCNGYYAGGYSDLAIFQTGDVAYGIWGYDLGVQASASFNYTQSSGLTIQYTAYDEDRSSRVLLICAPGTTQNILEFVGETVTTEYEFIFTSPCACPGACDNYGVINGPATTPATSETCTAVDSCTCDMTDGTGRVNLRSLALTGNNLYDAAFSVQTPDGWIYQYNPCEGFSYQLYSDLAIVQSHLGGGDSYDLGVQSTAKFLDQYVDASHNSLSIQYKAADGVRTSRVLLVCQPELNQNKFDFVGEVVTLEYDFILTSPCACPGLCDDNGPTISLPTPGPTPPPATTCIRIDACTCEMSDGSGRINLHGPAIDDYYPYDSAFTVYGNDGWFYKYNPCNGFYMGMYSDLAVYQSSDYYGYDYYGNDLGVQSTANFDYTEQDGVTIHYTSSDYYRSSRILLICAPDTTDHIFEFVGEALTNEFNFILRSPCACPGACDYNGVIGGPASKPPGNDVCTFVDSCTCDMADGSGRVNLHSLALEGDVVSESAFTVIGADSRTYKYNPCNGFTYYSFYDLAIVQQDSYISAAYDLGVQTRAQFGYTDAAGLAIYYEAYDGVRSSRVILICEPNLNANKFEFVGEIVTLEYDFILTTPCACPGYCDDNGPVVDLVTLPPSVGDGGLCDRIDSCTCEMSDGSGKINLHGISLEGTSLYDAAYTVYGDDGWYYKFNPCNGFYAANHYDLAVFQSQSASVSTTGNDLGVQTSAYFNYTQANGVSIHYKSADNFRNSRVLLICTPETTNHEFKFIGQLLNTEFDFTFTSPCACPGACDDDGVIGAPPPGTDYCELVDSCTCNMKDGSGQINLHSLAKEPVLGYLSESAFTVYGSDGWTYKYNPCNGFSFYIYSDLAVAQTDYSGYSGYDLGVQTKTYFTYQNAKGLSLLYTSMDGLRTSRVLLVCQSEVNVDTFEFVAEFSVAEYDFILSSPCACPGVCDENGPINTIPTPTPGQGGTGDKSCTKVDSCTCEMSDGSGRINLYSLTLGDYTWGDSAFTELGDDGYYYKYNPCYGFYFQYTYDTAIAQSYDFYGYGYGYVLGVQSSAKFDYSEASGVTLSYVSDDQLRSSRVLLVCEPKSNSHKFQVLGQTVSSEYEFMLTTPCACPGGCDDDGVVDKSSTTNCTKLDSCSCEMSDGTGRVNLRSIGLKGDSLTEAAFTFDGLDGWLYKYNPCTEFTYLYYDGLALAQVNAFGTAGHDLGVQRSADFKYSSVNGLSINYASSDNVRSSKVLLVCDPYAMETEFEFIGELTSLEYDFLLRTVCACPGGCTDFGPVNPIITQPPQAGGGGAGDMPDTVNVYQTGDRDPSYYFWPDVGGSTIALIFHDIFLILLIAAIIYLVKNVTFCRDQAAVAKQQFAHVKGTVTDDVTV